VALGQARLSVLPARRLPGVLARGRGLTGPRHELLEVKFSGSTVLGVTWLTLPTFVALDIETTGTDPAADAIIEIAAVRFVEGEERALFVELVNPQVPIPTRIRNLTGIHDGMVAGKPSIVDLVPPLLDFLGDSPLVVHNAGFDLGFLRAAAARLGLQLTNPCYDTVELARVAAPLAKNHRLATLARYMGLHRRHVHRAEDDARATGQLFSALLHRLRTADLGLLHAMLHLGQAGSWSPAPLVAALAAEKEASGETPSPVTRWVRPAPYALHRAEAAEPDEAPQSLDAAELFALMAPGGPVAEAFPAYEHRPQQMQMLRAVASAFSDGSHLLVEAGTGTGKSLGYLLPAFAWARQTGEKVVISTHTINLQEQLLEKDIPFLQQALAGTELDGIRAALAKGRSNYICLRKWEESATAVSFLATDEERQFHLRVASWLSETETGDKSELNLASDGERLWLDVMSETETCLGPKCKWFKSHCFAFRARQRAWDSDILVVNHSLLFSNLANDNFVLPPFRHLVIDEAHHVEQVATQTMGINLDYHDLALALAHLFRGFRHEAGPGVLTQLRRRLGRSLPARPPLGHPTEDHLEKLIDRIQSARAQADELFRLLFTVVEESGNGEEEGARTLRLVPAIRSGPLWQAVDAARGNLVHHLGMIGQGLTALCEMLPAIEPRLPDTDGLVADLLKSRGILGEGAADLNAVLLQPPEGSVTWVQAGGRKESPRVALRAAPVDVGPLLREQLFDRLRSVVMTSATLTVDGGFDHLKLRLGLQGLGQERLSEWQVDSPFRFRQQALLLVPDDMPNPRDARDIEYTRAVQEFLRRFLVAVGGRTLVLFTSHRQLRQVYQALRDDLEEAGLLLLGQGIDGARGKILEEFRTGDRSVLFGSSSFWEGVDVPGEGLSCVVLVRLPFSPPDEPVTEARIEDLERRGISSFRALSLPQAVIRFKQGFGRLIRTGSDRGVVVVLDNRVLRSRTQYGAAFLRSLPGPAVYAGPTTTVLERAVSWLNMETEE
jgi:ATP-dependent DNA helicase DinG